MRTFIYITVLLLTLFHSSYGFSNDIIRSITPEESLKNIEEPSQKQESLPTMIGQMIMVGFNGYNPKNVEDIAQDIEEGRVGGIILFSKDFTNSGAIRNIIDKQQTTTLIQYLQSKARVPLFVGVDQEGGRVQRFRNISGIPNTLSAAQLAQLGVSATQQQMNDLGLALQEMGVNLNFAPVIDLNINPFSPIIGNVERSYGKTTKEVLPHAISVINALVSHSIVFTLKHFPGHGSATVDSHYGLPDISATWTRQELEPYKELVQYSDNGMVLIGHLINKRIDPDYPSSLSYATITTLLRDEIGWTGVVITDDLQMQAITKHYDLQDVVIQAVNAGVDILLFGNNIEYDRDLPIRIQKILINAIRRGRVPIKRIEESYQRIMKLKETMLKHS